MAGKAKTKTVDKMVFVASGVATRINSLMQLETPAGVL